MVTLFEKVNKAGIPLLPQAQFEGRIVIVQTAESAKKAVDYLMKESILGIDTETRPSFKKGVTYKVALLQVSTHDTCFLFRLNRMGMPDAVTNLLANRKILKIGLSLKDDFHALHERAQYKNGKYVDLQDYVKDFGIIDMSLQKLYANIFNQRISKAQRLSNWEAQTLTEAQQRYAATDAWACIQIYEELEKLKATQNYKLISKVDENELAQKVIANMLENNN